MMDIGREAIDAVWDDFQTAAIGHHDPELGIELFDTDGMQEEAHGIYQIAIALRAALDRAEADKAAAVEAERERCAGVLDAECARILSLQDGKIPGVDTNLRLIAVLLPDLAAAIRAQGGEA